MSAAADSRVSLRRRRLGSGASHHHAAGVWCSGDEPPVIATNLDLPAQSLYDDLYCQRGEAENRIEKSPLVLSGTRASSQRSLANWLRVFPAGVAYTLMQRLRELALSGAELGCATAATIRVKLRKIGAAAQPFAPASCAPPTNGCARPSSSPLALWSIRSLS